ncbi:unnamed protein product [Cuscuta epithymum]|uniref:Uncharacterized protein n=1 Tax=Cuscuta epithymum TaxID=186058 RepID=A0AAV0DV81_9ASTE|nr:unnamed protein product [Cuscuta epithymum]
MNNQSFSGKDAIKTYLADNAGLREDLTMKLSEKLFHVQEQVYTEYADVDPIVPDLTDEEASASA